MDPALKEALDKLGMTTAQAVEAQQKAHKEFMDTVNADLVKRDAVYDAKVAKLQTELDKFEPVSAALAAAAEKAKADDEERKAIKESLEAIEAKVNRPPATHADEVKAKSEDSRKAFEEFCRRGEGRMTPERLNVMTLADDTSGGYLAPPEWVKAIILAIVEYSPMRKLVSVDSTSAKEIQYPKRTGLGSASWVGEIETRTETTNPNWGLETIPVHEMVAEYYVSRANLEDSAFDLEAILKDQFTEQFGVLEGQAMISGTGVKSIQGILTAAAISAIGVVSTVSGAATTVTADGLLTLKYGIKTGYAQNASFILNRSTLAAIRKLKDGNGQYLWVPGLAVGRPNAIDGDSYTEMPDMPSLSAGTKAVGYGDWKRGFKLVDRLAVQVMRDDYTRASVGQVKFVARRRLGGQVVLGESMAVMTTST